LIRPLPRWIECQGEAEMKAFLEGLQYPHWMIFVGTLLAMVGLVGFAFSKNMEGPSRASRKADAVRMRQ
jgi:hypothetical protein